MNGKAWITMGIAATLLASIGGVPAKAPVADRDKPAARRTFTVSVQGPSIVGVGDECAWTAVAQGGTPPYSYAWVGPFGGVGTRTVFWTVGSTGWHSMHVTAFDSNNQQADTEILVDAVPNADNC